MVNITRDEEKQGSFGPTLINPILHRMRIRQNCAKCPPSFCWYHMKAALITSMIIEYDGADNFERHPTSPSP